MPGLDLLRPEDLLAAFALAVLLVAVGRCGRPRGGYRPASPPVDEPTAGPVGPAGTSRRPR